MRRFLFVVLLSSISYLSFSLLLPLPTSAALINCRPSGVGCESCDTAGDPCCQQSVGGAYVCGPATLVRCNGFHFCENVTPPECNEDLGGIGCASCDTIGDPCCQRTDGSYVCSRAEPDNVKCDIRTTPRLCVDENAPTDLYPGPCNTAGQQCCESMLGPIVQKSCDETLNSKLYCNISDPSATKTCAIEICGTLGQSCCSKSLLTGEASCDTSLVCASDYDSYAPSVCVDPTCGNRNEPCCTGNTCNYTGLTCQHEPPGIGGFGQGPLTCVYTGVLCLDSTGYTCNLGVCPSGKEPAIPVPGGCGLGEVCCRPTNPLSEAFCDPDDGGPAVITDGIDTAIGCVSIVPSPLILTLLNWAIGLSGGVALLLVLIASVQIATATGDPKRLTAGNDLLFSAFAGITLITLAVILLNFIGVNVLGLSSLGFQL